MMTPEIQGPAWNNSKEYPAIQSAEFEKDLLEVERLVEEISQLSSKVTPFVAIADTLDTVKAKKVVEACQKVHCLRERLVRVHYNLYTFASCETSVDGKNELARTTIGKLQSLGARIGQAVSPVDMFLARTSEDIVIDFLSSPETKPAEFITRFERKRSPYLLSLEEENLLMSMGVNGISAWGNLYNTVSTRLVAEVDLPSGKQKMGLAQLGALLQDPEENVRKAAYYARTKAWEGDEDICAATLNAIVGWRLDEYTKRSHHKPFHFLDAPLHDNHIDKTTLEAMMESMSEFAPKIRHAAKMAARLLGKDHLDIWDLSSPAPRISSGNQEKLSFEQGLELVTNAYAQVDPEMGQFVNLMRDNEWIEGRVLPSKRPGAYCTAFELSKTPRVYMTYQGTLGSIETLAHELGHALHYWVMRDLPMSQNNVPMTLAETASVFGETVTLDYLMSNAKNPQDELEAQWNDILKAHLFLLGIPYRYEFEKALYEKRAHGSLSAADLSELMMTCIRNQYGDSVNLPESKSMNWASTLHYYISGLSFYNFPYSFGYLFALGVYAQWKKQGNNFYSSYVALLKDTGRMTAENLIQKHFQMNIREKQFWQDSLAIVQGKIQRFETFCQRILAEDDRR